MRKLEEVFLEKKELYGKKDRLPGSSGRQETDDGNYCTGGNPVKPHDWDGCRDTPYWMWACVENNYRDYYLAGYGDLNVSNPVVRMRGEG